MIKRAAHCNVISYGFIDGARCHVVRVDISISWTDAICDNDPFHAVKQWTYNGGIAWAVSRQVVLCNGASLDFMVVLT